MKLTYKQRLFLWFGVILLLFAVTLTLFERSRERQYKTDLMIQQLDAYAGMVNEALGQGRPLDSLLALFPPDIRVTVLDRAGRVLYENVFGDRGGMENHADRPEIIAAQRDGQGSSVRLSATTGTEYFYFARALGEGYVRVALPYNIQVRHFLRADNGFLYVTLLMFLAAVLFINYAAGRFGKSIARLADFATAAHEGTLEDADAVFPDDELGKVGEQIARGYMALTTSEKRSAQERERLLQHILISEEGVCFYTPEGAVEFYNSLFLQYLNILSDETPIQPDNLLENKLFAGVCAFLSLPGGENYYETTLEKQGRHFSVQTNRFADGSFEVILRDTTKQERTQQLKQEMTGNIAHELRTPVTSIRGYLETILEQPLDAEKQHHFITKAYRQTLSLSELIGDMGLLTRIEEAPHAFHREGVDLLQVVEKVCADMEIPLRENAVSVDVTIPPGTMVDGDKNLLYSIFGNLMDNAIKYAGRGVTIRTGCYRTDSDFYYFTFSDNGTGIADEHHLGRIFERFYRVSEGRTRDSGGSGLGLSIVRNAIAFHRGTISAKNRPGGGLEFLFKLPKQRL
ncbi:MAG: two-component sensor histidine kinase [Rikenellaceae bacterium]|jgi:signal transduction histidine kinase|nr:two-component sensor histidine kinase [Rikenellaceae bacterium]